MMIDYPVLLGILHGGNV